MPKGNSTIEYKNDEMEGMIVRAPNVIWVPGVMEWQK